MLGLAKTGLPKTMRIRAPSDVTATMFAFARRSAVRSFAAIAATRDQLRRALTRAVLSS